MTLVDGQHIRQSYPDRALPSSSKAGCSEPRYSRRCCTAASREPARVPLRHAAPSPSQLPDSLHRLAKEQSRRAHLSFLTRCIGWRRSNRADHPISYLDAPIKTGSESIEAALRRRRILFAEFVARMDDTRLPKCVMFGELVGGAGCVWGQEKEWVGCFLDDLRAFGINADQWTTAAQDEGQWRRTADQGAERFMAKLIVTEKARAGLRHAVVCMVTART